MKPALSRVSILTVLLVASLSLGLAACDGTFLFPASRSALDAAIASSRFEAFDDEAPEALVEALADRTVLLLGETHYVDAHQAFMAALMARLAPAGFRSLVHEGVAASSWIAEDYVSGRLDRLPASVAELDGPWLEGIRALNATLPEADRVSVGYFDMNHASDDFSLSLELAILAVGKELGLDAGAALARLRDDSLGPRGSDGSYGQAGLQAFRAGLPALLASGIVEAWLARLDDLAAYELRSAPVRASWSDEARERLILDRCLAFLARAEAGGGRLVINAGMNHVQKAMVLSGPKSDNLRRLLDARPETVGKLLSVAAAPIAGYGLARYYDEAGFEYDLRASGPDSNILVAMADGAGGRNAYLDLSGPLAGRKVHFHNRFGTTYSFVPYDVFDAMIAYPRGDIPAGMPQAR